MRHVPAGRLGAVGYLATVVSVLMSWALLDEAPTVLTLVGGAICLVGVVITRRRSAAKAVEGAAPEKDGTLGGAQPVGRDPARRVGRGLSPHLEWQGRVGRPLAQRAVVDSHVGLAEQAQRQGVTGGGDATTAVGDLAARFGLHLREDLPQLRHRPEGAVGRVEQGRHEDVPAARDAAGTGIADRLGGVEVLRRERVDQAGPAALLDDLLDLASSAKSSGRGVPTKFAGG